MTRFARAKGSKASNERVANDATPWHVMRENLQESISMKSDRGPKAKSAKELLSEKADEPYYHDATGNVNNEWAEFEKVEKEPAERPKRVTKVETSERAEEKETSETVDPAIESRPHERVENGHLEILPEPRTDGPKPSESKKKRKRNQRTIPPEVAKRPEPLETPDQTKSKVPAEEKIANGAKSDEATSAVRMSKRQKRNRKRQSKIGSTKGEGGDATGEKKVGTFDVSGNEWSSDVSFGKRARERRDAPPIGRVSDSTSRPPEPTKRKAPKIRDDREHKRRKPMTGSVKCTINGTEVEIVMYDGYPVKREDAERLGDLRKRMVMKGIPKSEIDQAMKLERRKAEKALARVRKQVCFHCRKAGHNLSDCPELGKEECATGICFKCGSTEHTHFECRVTKKEEFRFASCFICREQGHIAKQCPDNPRGLYPQGGACKICGDVTHLKKDCPDFTREKDEATLTVGTIAETTLESLDDDSAQTRVAKNFSKTSKSKIVQF